VVPVAERADRVQAPVRVAQAGVLAPLVAGRVRQAG
jgi:hypothetical protein